MAGSAAAYDAFFKEILREKGLLYRPRQFRLPLLLKRNAWFFYGRLVWEFKPIELGEVIEEPRVQDDQVVGRLFIRSFKSDHHDLSVLARSVGMMYGIPASVYFDQRSRG